MNWKPKALGALMALGLFSRWLASHANDETGGWNEILPVVDQAAVTLVFCAVLYWGVQTGLRALQKMADRWNSQDVNGEGVNGHE